MNKWILVLCILVSLTGNAQDFNAEKYSLTGVTTKKIRSIEKGKHIKLIGFKEKK